MLTASSEYSLKTQAKLVHAICCLHNVIMTHDPDDVFAEEVVVETSAPAAQDGTLGGPISQTECDDASDERDRIAQEMWVQYQSYMNEISLH